MGWSGFFTFTLNVRMGGCPAYAAPRTWRKSGSVRPTWVTLCRNSADPPFSTKLRTALPCSGFIQNCGLGLPGGTGGSEISLGRPAATQPALRGLVGIAVRPIHAVTQNDEQFVAVERFGV